jgi:hypothetical protein
VEGLRWRRNVLLMRLAYEDGLTYVVEDLEDKRETTAAQAALALEAVRFKVHVRKFRAFRA